MGYESKFYVIDKSNLEKEDGSRWGEVIAVFDMCKVYELVDKIKNYSPTNAYIFADDGNTEITEDRYNDPLTEIPIKDMIEILEELKPVMGSYRRYEPFLQMLKAFDTEEWHELVILHYGY